MCKSLTHGNTSSNTVHDMQAAFMPNVLDSAPVPQCSLLDMMTLYVDTSLCGAMTSTRTYASKRILLQQTTYVTPLDSRSQSLYHAMWESKQNSRNARVDGEEKESDKDKRKDKNKKKERNKKKREDSEKKQEKQKNEENEKEKGEGDREGEEEEK